ncbi:MAG: hypothetical protein RRA94_14055, partial [Bacteroidota bacterium]|nr:hypothetical protein [Bacteroidota bacterium]
LREAGSDRFNDTLQTLLTNGRRHGLGFCLTLETARSLDQHLARRIQTYFIGPITFADEPTGIANLLNLSEELLQPAVRYEDGDFLFTASDSPYHRRVPLPVVAQKNSETIHLYLDEMKTEQERRRQEYMAQEEERRKRHEQEREERRKREEKDREERRRREEKEAEEKRRREQEEASARAEQGETDEEETARKEDARAEAEAEEERSTTRSRRRRGGQRPRNADADGDDDPTDTDDAGTQENRSDDVYEAPFDEGDDAPQSGGREQEAPSPANQEKKDEKPVRKTTRGRRGGRGRKNPKKDENIPAAKEGAGDSTPQKSSESAPPASSLKIEEFDPNAGKSAKRAEEAPPSDAVSSKDEQSTGAKNSAEGEEKTDKGAAKKSPRRGSRRGGSRPRKGPSKSSGTKGEDG